MNEFRIFTPDEMESLKTVEKETPVFFGYVYFVEYGDYIKIGQTKNIYQRMSRLKNQAEKYANLKLGRIAISPKCTNYRKLEHEFHKFFQEYRKEGTELFNCDFSKLIHEVLGTNYQYLDESAEIEKSCEETTEWLKNLLFKNEGVAQGE